MMHDKYEYGLERDIFEDMESEELLILAAIGLHHVKEKAEDLRASHQMRIRDGYTHHDEKPTKQEVKDADHMTIQHYTRRNAERKAKETMMGFYGRYRNITMHKMFQKLEKERAEEKAKEKE